MKSVMQAVSATLIFLVMDAIWLGVLSKQLYLDEIGSILRLSGGDIVPSWPAAIVVYIALISGIVLLVLPKAQGDWLSAGLWGAFFGFVTYATYDFTNLAVLDAWTLKVSIIDVIWGMVLCGVTSLLTVLINR